MDKKFVFVGQIIPQDLLNENFDELSKMVDVAGNTFYTSLLEGLSDNGAVVYAESKVPRNLKLHKCYKKVQYEFVPYIQNKLLRYITLFVQGWRLLSRHRGKDTIAIFNVLRISSSLGAILACRFFGIKSIGVVTDVPGFRVQHKKTDLSTKLADAIGTYLVGQFDSYVLLSESMTDVISINCKPYTVIEGMYQLSQRYADKDFDYLDKTKFNVIYAGSLHYQYGVMNLVKAVMNSLEEEIVLHIFGTGEAETEIKSIADENPKIKYHGFIRHDDLLQIERQASLLVNPRPVNDEYVKYSFPSKNMEYMASGTPTLLTNIPSLPDEYKQFVLLAQNNTPDDLLIRITECFEKYSEYKILGEVAAQFIVSKKSNLVQSKKIIELVECFIEEKEDKNDD